MKLPPQCFFRAEQLNGSSLFSFNCKRTVQPQHYYRMILLRPIGTSEEQPDQSCSSPTQPGINIRSLYTQTLYTALHKDQSFFLLALQNTASVIATVCGDLKPGFHCKQILSVEVLTVTLDDCSYCGQL
jgi:hypothetical protein